MTGLVRGGLHVGAGTIASRVLGFARIVVLAWIVGAVGSRAADAFAVANQLPNNVFALISSGVFAAVLVPQAVRAAAHRDGGAAHINRLLTMGLSVLTLVTVAALVATPWLISLYTSGWPPDQLVLATTFALWCVPQIFFYGVFSLVGELLNARRMFKPAAWAPIANNVIALAGLIVFAFAFGARPGEAGSLAYWGPAQIAVLAGTTTLGVVVQAVLVVGAWRLRGERFRLDFRWRGLGLESVSRTASWTFAIVLVGQLLGMIQSRVTAQASGLGASVFATSTAWLLFMLPYSVIAVTMATVLFTRFSELGAQLRLKTLGEDVGFSAGALVVVMLGATVAMALIAVPVGRVLTESSAQAMAMASLLLAYLIGLVPLALLLLAYRAFYAVGDARTPFIYTCVQAAVVTVGTLAVPSFARPEHLGVAVAGVQSLGTMIQAIAAFILLRRRLGPATTSPIGTAVGRATIAMIPASVVAGGTAAWVLGGWGMSDRASAFAAAAMIGLTFATLYAGGLWILREPAFVSSSPASSIGREGERDRAGVVEATAGSGWEWSGPTVAAAVAC